MIQQKLGQLEILTIKGYRGLSSPVYSFLNYFNINPLGCRYAPSCSRYFEEAIREFGAFKGSVLGFKRIMRCNPTNVGGYDPVPKKKTE